MARKVKVNVFRQYRNVARSFVLALAMTAIAFVLVARDARAIPAEGPFIIDSWLEEPNLKVSYIWNLYERRDGWYIDNWSEDQLAAVDTFEFGMREAFKHMGLSDIIDAQHDGDAWIQLYNVAANDPDDSHDYPPHINIISYWGEADREYPGGVNGHFYFTESGQLDPSKTWYAWQTDPECEPGERNPGIDTWTPHVDRNCATIWEERVTGAGEIQVRRDANGPVYSVRATAPRNVEVLRDGERIRTVHRVFHNAWIDYPEPYPDGIAKVVWEIHDDETNLLTTETIIARPETGEIVSHERVDEPLNEPDEPDEPEADIIYLPILPVDAGS